MRTVEGYVIASDACSAMKVRNVGGERRQFPRHPRR